MIVLPGKTLASTGVLTKIGAVLGKAFIVNE
jgi:hypothetical protein